MSHSFGFNYVKGIYKETWGDTSITCTSTNMARVHSTHVPVIITTNIGVRQIERLLVVEGSGSSIPLSIALENEITVKYRARAPQYLWLYRT